MAQSRLSSEKQTPLEEFSLNEMQAQDIVDTARDALLVLSPDLTVMSANRAFYATFKTCAEDTLGRRLYDLGNGQWNIRALRLLLEEIVPTDTTVRSGLRTSSASRAVSTMSCACISFSKKSSNGSAFLRRGSFAPSPGTSVPLAMYHRCGASESRRNAR